MMAVQIPTDPRKRKLFEQWVQGIAARPQGGVGTAVQQGPTDPQKQIDYRNWISAAQGHIAPTPLGAGELLSFQQRRQAANNSYLDNLAQLDFQRGSTRSGFQREARDFRQRSNETRQGMPAQYAQRGLLTSGIYRGALGDNAQQNVKTYNDILSRRQAAMGGFDLQQTQLERGRATQLQDIEAQKRARQMELANQLRGIGG